jgi:RNA polymerase sigma-70 factor (ECF subfamily)
MARSRGQFAGNGHNTQSDSAARRYRGQVSCTTGSEVVLSPDAEVVLSSAGRRFRVGLMHSPGTAAPRGAPAVGSGPAGSHGLPLRDAELVGQLLARNEGTFREVVASWGPGLLRMAGNYLSSHASAEEVVQETWMAVLGGLAGFQGRSSLRTWVFRVLINTAKARAQQEGRTVPVAELDDDRFGRPAPRGGFRRGDKADSGCWISVAAPAPWHDAPEPATLAAEAQEALRAALLRLPERQLSVVTLRDIHGFTNAEICELLDLSAANQRVLLHRARTALRDALNSYYAERKAGASSPGRSGTRLSSRALMLSPLTRQYVGLVRIIAGSSSGYATRHARVPVRRK